MFIYIISKTDSMLVHFSWLKLVLKCVIKHIVKIYSDNQVFKYLFDVLLSSEIHQWTYSCVVKNFIYP